MRFSEHACKISVDNYKPFTKDVSFEFLDRNQPISVYYLEASLGLLSGLQNIPLPIPQAERSIFTVNGYHTGIGFVTRKGTGKYAFVLDLIAPNGMVAAILPTIDGNTLTWNNQTQITYNDIDNNYWDHSTYICDITRQNLIDLTKDILYTYVPVHPLYTLFRVAKSPNIQDLLNPEMTSTVCDDFAYFILNTLQKKYGAKVFYQTHPKINMAAFITNSEPKKLDPIQDKETILTFYRTVLQGLNKLSSEYQQIVEKYKKNHKVDFVLVQQMLAIIVHDMNLPRVVHYCVDDTGEPAYYLVNLTKPKIEAVFTNYPLDNNIKPLCIMREGFSNGGDNDHHNNIIGIIILCVLGVILLITLLYLFFRRRTNNNVQNFNFSYGI